MNVGYGRTPFQRTGMGDRDRLGPQSPLWRKMHVVLPDRLGARAGDVPVIRGSAAGGVPARDAEGSLWR